MQQPTFKQKEPLTRVVNIKSGEKYDVYIGRAGHGKNGYFGNPFPLKPNETRQENIEKYKKYFYNRIKTDEAFKQAIFSLKGKVLGCFCKPKLCHGDIICDYLNNKRFMI